MTGPEHQQEGAQQLLLPLPLGSCGAEAHLLASQSDPGIPWPSHTNVCALPHVFNHSVIHSLIHSMNIL
jgi:hypothetical protein